MKTDSQIQRDVLDELKFQPNVKETDIGVIVSSGMVRLTGTVPSFNQVKSAVEAAQRIKGVKAVSEEIKVELEHEITDTDIAQTAANILDWNVSVPSEDVKLSVKNGWVTLSGEVEWQYQKETAENTIANLNGVTGITNNILLKPKTTTAKNIKKTIENALHRVTSTEAKKLHVVTSGGKITLSGTVSSLIEKNTVEAAVRAIPGVLSVENNIAVSEVVEA